MKFPLNDNIIPIMTTTKNGLENLFQRVVLVYEGDTDNKKLKEQNVNIWNGNGSREFLDSRNLRHYEEDDLGPIYGYQWRNFDMPYRNATL